MRRSGRRSSEGLHDPQIRRLHGGEYPLDARRFQPVHALKKSGEEAAIIRHHRIVAVLKQLGLLDLDLLAENAAAIDAAAHHPVHAAVAVVGAAVTVLAEGAAELGNRHNHGVTPRSGPDLLGEAGQGPAEFAQPIGEIAGRRTLVDVGVPAADIDEAQVELLAHQPSDPPGGELETAGRHRAAIGRGHLLGDRAVDIVAHAKTFRDRTGEIAVLVHALDQPGLAVIDARLADAVDAGIGNLGLAAECQRQLVGEGDRLHPGQFAGEPAHEAGAVVTRAADRLAELDGVLGLKMASAEIIGGACERDEGDFPLVPQRIDAVAQRRVQPPVGVKRERRVRVSHVGLGDGKRRPGVAIKIARHRDHHIGRVVSATQKHHQQPCIGGRCRPDPPRHRHRRECGESLDQITTVHGRLLPDVSPHEFRRRQKQRIPVLRRHRLIEGGHRGRAHGLAQGVEEQGVLQQRERRLVGGVGAFRLEQPRRARADLPRHFEPQHHLARTVPGGRRQRIAVRRVVIEQALGKPVQPVLHRRRVENDLAIVSQPHRGHHVLHRILELRAGLQRGSELRRVHHGREHRGDIAIGLLEGLRHVLHQRGRRIVADEIGGDLLRDVGRGRRMPTQDVEGFVDFGEATSLDGVAQESLVAVVMPRRIEFEQALAHQLRAQLRLEIGILGLGVDADAGENARQLLYVRLGIARADAHGVQLHNLAGVVFVQVAGGVVGIVEIAHHRRMVQRRAEQVAETAKRMRPDGAVDVVADQDAQVGLVLVHVEVIEPEPGHAFAQLLWRVECAQDGARGRLAGAIVHRLLISLLSRFSLVRIGDLVGGAALLVEFRHHIERQLVHIRHCLDLRLRCRRHRRLQSGRRVQLLVEPQLRAHGLKLRHARRCHAEGQPIEQREIVRVQFGGMCTGHRADAADEQCAHEAEGVERRNGSGRCRHDEIPKGALAEHRRRRAPRAESPSLFSAPTTEQSLNETRGNCGGRCRRVRLM